MSPILESIPLEQLQPGAYQPRKNFEPHALEELAQSIKTQGLIEPLIIRAINTHQFEIIAGERRWRAAQLAGLAEIPCLITTYTNEEAAAVALIENIQRADLNILEEATAYQRLLEEFNHTQASISSLVGKSRSHIANLLRLLSLCDVVKAHISDGVLSLGHARMLVGLTPQQQIAFSQKIQRHDWSVRQLEVAVREEKVVTNQPFSDPNLSYLETQLSEQLGTPVTISTQPNQSGQIIISYFDLDTFQGLLERLGLAYDESI